MPEKDYVWLPRSDILDFEEVSRLVDVFIGLGVDRVRLTGGPKSAVGALVSRMNPLLDLSTFTFPVTLESINITQGAMELVGHGVYTAEKK
jgi:molybdenum cofactor biosynthesis enzyme MoaA